MVSIPRKNVFACAKFTRSLCEILPALTQIKEEKSRNLVALTYVRGEEHQVQRSHEVVHPLNVAASWVSDRPYVQYPLHRSLYL